MMTRNRLARPARNSAGAGALFDRSNRRAAAKIGRLQQVIRLHLAAPAKPPEHQPCNGCGVCCAVAPCPIGAVVSRRLEGPCDALVWVDDPGLYRCGLIARPEAHWPRMLHHAAPWLAGLARRYVSAGSGCDSSLSATVFPPLEP